MTARTDRVALMMKFRLLMRSLGRTEARSIEHLIGRDRDMIADLDIL